MDGEFQRFFEMKDLMESVSFLQKYYFFQIKKKKCSNLGIIILYNLNINDGYTLSILKFRHLLETAEK